MHQHKLISVIIPAYNHAGYLPQAIDSVLQQNYPFKEIIVVDDGSTDNTRDVMANYPAVKYVHQHNQGLSAARNTGIEHSTGEYLAFLDADDWFYPDALMASTRVLEAHPQAAFSYGDYKTVNSESEIIPENTGRRDFADNPYRHLLENNFVAMHATVLYQRRVFDRLRFDTALPACEDYDLYLKIVRDHPIVYHSFVVAAYRRHSYNMSGNVKLMLSTVLKVLQRQAPHLRNKSEKEALKKGKRHWKDHYGRMLYWQLERTPFFSFGNKRRRDLVTLATYNKKLFLTYLKSKTPWT